MVDRLIANASQDSHLASHFPDLEASRASLRRAGRHRGDVAQVIRATVSYMDAWDDWLVACRLRGPFFAGTLGDRKKFAEGGLLITLSSLLCFLFFLYFEIEF